MPKGKKKRERILKEGSKSFKRLTQIVKKRKRISRRSYQE
jgi:hypothetical protein